MFFGLTVTNRHMKKIKLSILILGLIVVIYGCCKNNSNSPKSIFEGKIKTIEIIDSLSSTGIYNYIYDSNTLYLKKIIYDSIYFNIFYNGNNITTRSNLSNIISIATISNNKLVSAINLDTMSNIETGIFRISRDNLLSTDTVIEITGLSIFPDNLKNYNYIYSNDNAISHEFSWTILDFFSGVERLFKDTITYEYDTRQYRSFIPAQNPFCVSLYIYTGVVQDYGAQLNVVELNGGTLVFKNKNLIKSLKSAKFGYITNYSYTFNTLNQVTEMRISKPDGTGTALTYKMTYY